ncbi:MAG: murein biosynthesis integral membrane protein MurJ [Candidatus Omnitrophica bacterium]|jgi:putative peptidoglycan lipid II flippase|nr:murein biosynthesis integral membrane protein MurJ [Candidatus Omnitrophota bacterium]MDD5660554.1 murein biosynthesis integral membrane protein MurJ [Candidatus Omnitrophota bacterium]
MSITKYPKISQNQSVARWAATISLATFISRILGFIRDVIIARLFGVYVYAQAFVIAFRIPNLFRDMVAEGASNAAIVPVLSEYSLKRSKAEFWELANLLLNLLIVVLSAITILGIIFSPVIVRMIAPGFIASPDKLQATINLNRIIFPYILLIGLAAYAMAVLNSLKDFAVSAFAPCLLNIAIIICAMLFGENILGLATGVLIGGLLQLAVQVPVLYKKGFRPKLALCFNHPGVIQVRKLMLPRLASSGIYQLNNFVDSIFASLAVIVGEGGVAVLYFAYRLIQFPIGIFSNAIAQAILPTFSTQALEETHDELKATLSWGLRAVFFVMLPVTAIFMVLAQPLVFTLFGGGKFDFSSGFLTANALFFYSIGLSAYGGTKILQSCFFALKDTVTPTKIAGLALGINTILNAVLMFPLKIGGLALATSISGIITFLFLFFILKKRLNGIAGQKILNSFLRILTASFCTAVVCFLVNRALNFVWALFFGALSYFVFCFLFKITELKEFMQRSLWAKRKT